MKRDDKLKVIILKYLKSDRIIAYQVNEDLKEFEGYSDNEIHKSITQMLVDGYLTGSYIDDGFHLGLIKDKGDLLIKESAGWGCIKKNLPIIAIVISILSLIVAIISLLLKIL